MEILDNKEPKGDLRTDISKANKKFAFIILGLAIFDTAMFTYFLPTMNAAIRLQISIINFGFSFNLIGFVLGTITATIPYKRLNYGQKYLRASLINIIVLDSLFALGLIVGAIRMLIEHH